MKPMTSKEGRSAYYERPAKEGKRDKEAERKAKICLSCTKAKCKGTCELMRSRNDKQKEIEKMAKAIYETGIAIDGTDIAFGLIDDSHFERMARKLVAEGYGDIRAAVKEFAESVKMAFYYEFDALIPSIMADKIDELVKEVCGDE